MALDEHIPRVGIDEVLGCSSGLCRQSQTG
jgi:hypothetical protein